MDPTRDPLTPFQQEFEDLVGCAASRQWHIALGFASTILDRASERGIQWPSRPAEASEQEALDGFAEDLVGLLSSVSLEIESTLSIEVRRKGEGRYLITKETSGVHRGRWESDSDTSREREIETVIREALDEYGGDEHSSFNSPLVKEFMVVEVINKLSQGILPGFENASGNSDDLISLTWRRSSLKPRKGV